jgi:hypothetical protein
MCRSYHDPKLRECPPESARVFEDPTDRYAGKTLDFVSFDEAAPVPVDELERAIERLENTNERIMEDLATNRRPPPVSNGQRDGHMAPPPMPTSPAEDYLFERLVDLEARIVQLEKRVFPPAGFDERAYMRAYMKKYRRAKKSKKPDKS